MRPALAPPKSSPLATDVFLNCDTDDIAMPFPPYASRGTFAQSALRPVKIVYTCGSVLGGPTLSRYMSSLFLFTLLTLLILRLLCLLRQALGEACGAWMVLYGWCCHASGVVGVCHLCVAHSPFRVLQAATIEENILSDAHFCR